MPETWVLSYLAETIKNYSSCFRFDLRHRTHLSSINIYHVIYLYYYLSIYSLSNYPSNYLAIHPYQTNPFIHHIHLSITFITYLSSIYLSIYLSVCLSVYLIKLRSVWFPNLPSLHSSPRPHDPSTSQRTHGVGETDIFSKVHSEP